MRAALSLAISLALAAPFAAVAAGPDAFTESVVEFTVNGQPGLTTLVVRRDADGTLLLRAEDLAKLRLKKPQRGALLVNGERYYRLGSELGASVNFDPTTQHAEVTLPPDAFVGTVADAGGVARPVATTPGLGGFLNYELYGERSSDRNSFGGVAELGLFTPRGVGTSTLLGRDDAGGRSLVRLDTTWTLDLPERLATLRVGDAISASGAWGRSVRFGGLQFGTNFATQPTLVTTPLLSAQGSAVVPSTVDIFVNGSRVASQDVPPGPFTIDHVPAITGAGQMQVVVTDALGRQQVISQSYYTGPSLLRAGLNEYSFELGSLRSDYGYRSNEYSGLVAAGTFRRGLTDQLTAEVHAEIEADGPAAAGANASWQAGSIGILSGTLAVGGDDETGWLAGVGFERNGQRANLFARTQYASETFAQLGSDEQLDQPRQRTFVGFGLDFARYGNLQVAYGVQSYWTGPTQETVGVSHAVTLGDMGFLNLILSQSIGEDESTDVFLNWTLPLGERRSAAVSLRQSSATVDGDEFAAVASLQQSLPAGTGVGYQVTLASNEEAQLGYAYQGRAGTAGVQYARRNGGDGWRADVSGGLALTSAGVMPSRQLDRSFAVVKVADYEDLTVYVENQPIGRTDSHGRILLDGLRPYERNEISIDPRQLPMDAVLAVPRLEVTPAYRSGPVVTFPVTRSQPATLRLVQADGSPVPPGATVHTEHETAPVGLRGLVYLTEATGSQRARADWGNGRRCEFDFTRADGADAVPDLGTIECRDATD